jgi:hypothetical protein
MRGYKKKRRRIWSGHQPNWRSLSEMDASRRALGMSMEHRELLIDECALVQYLVPVFVYLMTDDE